jgi:hypothetical protein
MPRKSQTPEQVIVNEIIDAIAFGECNIPDEFDVAMFPYLDRHNVFAGSLDQLLVIMRKFSSTRKFLETKEMQEILAQVPRKK